MKKVIEGRISSPFGNRIHPVTKEKKFHNGIDIAAPKGTPVYSPCEGTVTGVYTKDAGGLQVVIIDAKLNRFGFAHLEKSLVNVGQKVARGQQIALCGNSGTHITGPHLHFTHSVNGVFDDPTPYLTID